MSSLLEPRHGERIAGATVRPRYMRRVVDTYPISESEMLVLSAFNDQITVRFATATFLAGLAFSFFTGGVFADRLNAVGALAVEFVAPLLLLAAASFAVGGLIAQRQKRTEWERIRRESMPEPASALLEIGAGAFEAVDDRDDGVDLAALIAHGLDGFHRQRGCTPQQSRRHG
ncbi:MAG TPA: hypothetical protein VG328_21695 [Stellaceae bacterium]|jgi:hypothetical protein|nr:hypothetical protein [Stellaceae bacterium]